MDIAYSLRTPSEKEVLFTYSVSFQSPTRHPSGTFRLTEFLPVKVNKAEKGYQGLDQRIQRIVRTSQELKLEPDETKVSVFTTKGYRQVEAWLKGIYRLCTDLTHSKGRNADSVQTTLAACKDKIDQLRDQLMKARAVGIGDEYSRQVETQFHKTESLLAKAIIDREGALSPVFGKAGKKSGESP